MLYVFIVSVALGGVTFALIRGNSYTLAEAWSFDLATWGLTYSERQIFFETLLLAAAKLMVRQPSIQSLESSPRRDLSRAIPELSGILAAARSFVLNSRDL